MISLENEAFNTFTKFPKNVSNLGKIVIAAGFKKWPKVP